MIYYTLLNPCERPKHGLNTPQTLCKILSTRFLVLNSKRDEAKQDIFLKQIGLHSIYKDCAIVIFHFLTNLNIFLFEAKIQRFPKCMFFKEINSKPRNLFSLVFNYNPVPRNLVDEKYRPQLSLSPAGCSPQFFTQHKHPYPEKVWFEISGFRFLVSNSKKRSTYLRNQGRIMVVVFEAQKIKMCFGILTFSIERIKSLLHEKY